MNVSALQFLILAMNKEQTLFQFEFYNFNPAESPFLKLLDSGTTVVRAEAKQLMPDFAAQARASISWRNEQIRTA